MTHARKLARDDFITEALRAANDAIGNDPPTDQTFKIIAALKSLRDDQPPRLTNATVDYLRTLQEAAKAGWSDEEKQDGEDEHSFTAGLQTPIGRLTCTTWRRSWSGTRGEREAWVSEYYLDGEPITVREIKSSGLAERPTKRPGRKKEAGI